MTEIITDLNKPQPLTNFAKKDKVFVPSDILSEMRVVIPPIYYWEDVEGGVSSKMTMAFQYKGRNYGMSYLIEDTNVVKVDILRKKLFATVRESLDALVHHGEKVLDLSGNIDPRLVNQEEAIRYKYDKYWDKKVAAFYQLCRIMPITKKKAIELKLLDALKAI